MEGEMEAAQTLREQLRQIMLKRHGMLRYGPEHQTLMEQVMSFRERMGFNVERCGEVLGIKKHQVAYLRHRYRQLFQKDPEASGKPESIFHRVHLKKEAEPGSGRFSFQLGYGVSLRVEGLADVLAVIHGLRE